MGLAHLFLCNRRRPPAHEGRRPRPIVGSAVRTTAPTRLRLTVDCRLRCADHRAPQPTAYGFRLTAYGLRLTAYSLRPTAYGLQLTAYGLRLLPRHGQSGTVRRPGSVVTLPWSFETTTVYLPASAQVTG